MGIKFDEIKGYVDLEFPELLLRGGEYSLVIVVQTNIFNVQLIDLVKGVFNFKVFPGDYWKSGKINRATNIALIFGKYIN